MPCILITGANRGIGLEMTRQYAADGWRVIAACRDPSGARDLRRLEETAAGSVRIHQLEVTDGARIRALARELGSESIDVLLNNAGVYAARGEDLGKMADEDWLEALRVNTIAPFRMAEAFVEQVARSRRRVIATVSSKMGSIDDNTSGGRYAYRSSKAAVNMVTKSLAVDLRPRGIIAVALNPGWVRTRMGGSSAPLGVEESVRGLRSVIEGLTPDRSGCFLNHDGSLIPW